MARKRTPPRKRRTTTTARAQTAAPKASSDGRLTDAALRAHVRKSKGPVFNILKPFEVIKETIEH